MGYSLVFGISSGRRPHGDLESATPLFFPPKPWKLSEYSHKLCVFFMKGIPCLKTQFPLLQMLHGSMFTSPCTGSTKTQCLWTYVPSKYWESIWILVVYPYSPKYFFEIPLFSMWTWHLTKCWIPMSLWVCFSTIQDGARLFDHFDRHLNSDGTHLVFPFLNSEFLPKVIKSTIRIWGTSHIKYLKMVTNTFMMGSSKYLPWSLHTGQVWDDPAASGTFHSDPAYKYL